jgi:hypothetical protein
MVWCLIKEIPWTGGLAQVVAHMPSKQEGLSSNPNTAKKKKKKFLTLPLCEDTEGRQSHL